MSHGIDLTGLTVEQLIELNRDVVARAKLLRQKESYKALAKFNVGDRIYFETLEGRTVKGTIVRLNKKSATIECEHHQRWNVSPHLLRKSDTKHRAAAHNVVTLRK